MPTRNETLQVIFDSSELDIAFDDFKKASATWKVTPIMIDNCLSGGIMQKNSELHACVKKEFRGRWFNKSIIKLINSVIKNYGIITTKVAIGDKFGHAFVSRIGFEPQKTDGIYQVYSMTKQIYGAKRWL